MLDSAVTGPDMVVKFPFEVKAVASLQGFAETEGRELHYLK